MMDAGHGWPIWAGLHRPAKWAHMWQWSSPSKCVIPGFRANWPKLGPIRCKLSQIAPEGGALRCNWHQFASEGALRAPSEVNWCQLHLRGPSSGAIRPNLHLIGSNFAQVARNPGITHLLGEAHPQEWDAQVGVKESDEQLWEMWGSRLLGLLKWQRSHPRAKKEPRCII